MTSTTTSASTAEASEPQQSDLERAQQRLVQVAMAQRQHPLNFGLSAYANGLLHTARLDAVIELLTTGVSPCTKEALDAAVIRALERKTQQLQDQARLIQPPSGDAPSDIIVRPN